MKDTLILAITTEERNQARWAIAEARQYSPNVNGNDLMVLDKLLEMLTLDAQPVCDVPDGVHAALYAALDKMYDRHPEALEKSVEGLRKDAE